jgi:GNAT superfamily N-acetyltransferase
VPALNDWFRRFALQQMERRISTTHVAVLDNGSVCGFWTLSVGEFRGGEILDAWARKLPSRIPVLRLCRLAVARQHHGTGLGSTLLADAISLAQAVSARAVGGVGLVVDAKPEACAFYAKYGFIPITGSQGPMFLAFPRNAEGRRAAGP